jgi:hypothetical protein
MAKIGIVTRSVDPLRLQLALALKSQQHEIIFITSQKDSNETENTFQSLRFFNDWSLPEATQFFLKTWNSLPEILHFTFGESSKDLPHSGHCWLAQLTRAIPGKVIATSFFGPVEKGVMAKILTLQSDIVTASTRESLMLLKRKKWMNSYCETEVLPPLYTYFKADNKKQSPHPELIHLCQQISPFAFFPQWPKIPQGQVLHHQMFILVHEKRSQMKALRNRKSSPFFDPEKAFFTGLSFDSASDLELQHHFLKTAISKARFVVTAFQDIPLTLLQRIHQIATKYQVPVVATPLQTEMLPGLCIDRRNGFLVRTPQDLEKILLKPIDDGLLENPIFETGSHHLSDHSVNELSRLYLKARSKKLLPRRGQEWVK